MSGSLVLRRIREEFEWYDYVTEHYDVKPATNGELRICCPSCGDQKFKCYVNVDKRLFNCYKCEFKTGKFDCVDFVALTEGMPRAKAQLKLIKEYQPLTPDDNVFLEVLHDQRIRQHAEEPVSAMRSVTLPLEAVRLVNGEGDGADAWRYLTGRGLTPDEIRDCQTHFIPDASCAIYTADGEYAGDIGSRVLWPVFGPGMLVSWIARDISGDDGAQKYIVCPASDMKKTLWPYLPPHTPKVILVEGLLDALAVRRLGPPTSVYATWGKAIGEEQILLLKEWGVEDITLFWDKKDARKEMLKAVEKLSMRFDSVNVCDMSNWPKTLDPGKCLELPDGTAMLRHTLSKRISSYDTIGFGKWQTSF